MVVQSNQGMGRRSGGDGLDSMFWIEGCLALEHGASDGEQAVGDTPQGAAMEMTSLAQFRIAGAACDHAEQMSRERRT
jgi:hypothetical protein